MKLKFIALLLIFLINFTVIDSMTTITALNGNCYESNIVIKNLGLIKAKLLSVLIIIPTSIWLYRKNSKIAIETLKLLTAFSFGIILNNILNIVGGVS